MVVLNPLLFVIFTFLVELKGNFYETSLPEVGILFFIFGGVVTVAQLFFFTLIKNKYKVSVISALFAFMFLSFGLLFPYHTTMKWIQKYPLCGFNLGSYKYIFPLYWVFFGIGAYWIYRFVECKFIACILDKTIMGLVIFNSLLLVPDVIETLRVANDRRQTLSAFPVMNLRYGYKPDIYYIMLDGYPREDILKSYFAFDNSSFLETLRKKHFFVADQSCSNYPATALSLPSIFDMNYLHATEVDFKNFFKEGFVFNFLRSNGYKLINVSGNFGFTAANKAFHETKGNFLLKSFAEHFFWKTAFFPFMSYFYPFDKAEKIRLQLSTLKNIPLNQHNPHFVFCHIMSPHLPFSFDKNGNSLIKNQKPDSLRFLQNKEDREALGNQLKTLNKLVIDTIDVIQETSKKPPVIIIQSDHGTGFSDRSDRHKRFSFDVSRMIIKERMSNLNAWYFPQSSDVIWPDSISNVNTFRVVFNNCFDTCFSLLKDECYWQEKTWRNARQKPYTLSEINAFPLPSLDQQKEWMPSQA